MTFIEHRIPNMDKPAAVSHQLGQCIKLLIDKNPQTFLIDHSFSILIELMNLPESTNRKDAIIKAMEFIKENLGLDQDWTEKLTRLAQIANYVGKY